MKRRKMTLATVLLCSFFAVGCTPSGNPSNNTGVKVEQSHSDAQRVVSAKYDTKRQTVSLLTEKSPGKTGEDIVDVSSPDGITNYVTARYPDVAIRSVQIRHASGGSSTLATPNLATVHPAGTPMSGAPQTGTSPSSGTQLSQALAAGSLGSSLPPGVRLDGRIRPLAGLTASVTSKQNAVLQVARSKLGTPYVWGHNADRGQFGFDCSNFTEYVYHHALGYLMTTSSRGQYTSVGVRVAPANMRTGDLLIFNQGSHVGIYAGNGQMIEEGGGLGKVGYLSVKPGSYWGSHLSAVKRMF